MNQETWLELDLYYFQGAQVETKAHALFERWLPVLNRAPAARKGFGLGVGWLPDAFLSFNGELDDVIPCCQPPLYEVWTYRRVAEVVRALRQQAEMRGLTDFHVTYLFLGIDQMVFSEKWNAGRTESVDDRARYHIEKRWFSDHPELYDTRFNRLFYGTPFQAPFGEKISLHPETFGDYYVDKLLAFSRAIGCDAALFRDDVFVGPYVRSHTRDEPKWRYMPPDLRDEFMTHVQRMFARLKAADPAFITMGYSSGSSSVEDWRSQGFDLEALARSGNLDLWITQTWPGAWGDFWPCHASGYTFQLMNALVEQTMLAGTPCKHLFLIETWDAWEPYETIHQFPSKLAWVIWALSHATVLGPDGTPQRTPGIYVSWLHKESELLPEKSVRWLLETMSDAEADALRNPRPAGPCIVWHHDSMTQLLAQPRACSRGEEVDDWAAVLLKYGVPTLCATRAEWLPAVQADAFIVPVPHAWPQAALDTLLARARRGTPVLLLGEVASYSPAFRATFGLQSNATSRFTTRPSSGVFAPQVADLVGSDGVCVNQRYRSLETSPAWETMLTALDGPVLAKHSELPVLVWEAPEWGTLRHSHLTWMSLQSPQTYLAVAKLLSAQGWGAEALGFLSPDPERPLPFLAWRHADGSVCALIGNLEKGYTGESQFGGDARLSINGLIETIVDTARRPLEIKTHGNWVDFYVGAHKTVRLSLIHKI